jgi:hypothetical protein
MILELRIIHEVEGCISHPPVFRCPPHPIPLTTVERGEPVTHAIELGKFHLVCDGEHLILFIIVPWTSMADPHLAGGHRAPCGGGPRSASAVAIPVPPLWPLVQLLDPLEVPVAASFLRSP